MDKTKYAFIMMSGTLTPDVYSTIHENSENYDLVAAVKSVKMAGELAEKLGKDGFTAIDLCGAFNEEKAARVKAAGGGQIDVRYAKYSPEDDKRMDAMESLGEFGIILMEGPLSETQWLRLESDEFNTTIGLVPNLKAACEAASRMVKDGIVFIEMCRWFDEEKAGEVIKAIGGAVPVGYCG